MLSSIQESIVAEISAMMLSSIHESVVAEIASIESNEHIKLSQLNFIFFYILLKM